MEFVPEIDDDIPLPVRASDVLPDLSPQEELEMRVNTIKLLADLSGKPISATPEHEAAAQDLAKKMIMDPKMRPEYAKYPNEVIAHMAGMVARVNHMIVDELSDLKLFVVNSLVKEAIDAATSKDRIAALKSLGEVDGIDAFKRRSEITMQVKSIQEVEQELMTVLDGIEYTVLPDNEGVEAVEESSEAVEDGDNPVE